jgi:hypothetical protein
MDYVTIALLPDVYPHTTHSSYNSLYVLEQTIATRGYLLAIVTRRIPRMSPPLD